MSLIAVSYVASAIAPRSLRVEGLVDGLNRKINGETLANSWLSALAGYKQHGRPQGLRIDAERAEDDALALWLAAQLRR